MSNSKIEFSYLARTFFERYFLRYAKFSKSCIE